MANFNKILRFNIPSLYKNLIRSNSNITSIQNVIKPTLINFTPTLLQNDWIYQQNTKIESPLISKINYDLPLRINKLNIIDLPNLDPNKVIEDPETVENKIEKHAVRLIVIRRHKMRKHKLKKLRKKMKFEWAKLRQRREMRKEKEFQAGLIAQIKQAEAFSAENYVAEKIKAATETPIPRLWKGKRKPEFLIRQLMGLPPK